MPIKKSRKCGQKSTNLIFFLCERWSEREYHSIESTATSLCLFPRARTLGCTNSKWPDIHGHYREAKFTQVNLLHVDVLVYRSIGDDTNTVELIISSSSICCQTKTLNYNVYLPNIHHFLWLLIFLQYDVETGFGRSR